MGREFDHSFNLAGRVAAVTGANTGLGRAIAEALAGAGADVALIGRSDPADTLAAIQSLGRRAIWVNADLGTNPTTRASSAKVVAKLGGLHILVNNAGIIRRANAIDFTEADWDAVLDVNLKSVFFLSQAAARHMIPHGGGKIINIASMLSFQGGIRVPSYTASKSGIAGLTRLLANEWAASAASMSTPSRPAISPPTTPRRCRPTRSATRKSSRVFPPVTGEIHGNWAARPCSSLPSAANYVHGIILPVDGGWLAR